MRAARRFWRGRVAPFFSAVLDALDAFLDEAAFRSRLAWAVLSGRVPVEGGRRWWNRATETPVLVDAFDWTDERLLFSVLVWPSLEETGLWASAAHEARVGDVKGLIARGAAGAAWSMRLETDRGLAWDHEREVWTDPGGYAFDGARLRGYSRGGEVGGAA